MHLGSGTSTRDDEDRLFRWQGDGAFKSMWDQSGLCLARLDLGLRVVEANSEFAAQFGVSGESMRGRTVFGLLHPDVHALMRRQFDRILNDREPRFVEHLTGIGPHDAVFTGMAVHGSSGELAQIVVVVTPEKPEVAIAVDRDLRLTELNARILEGIAMGETTIRLSARLFLSAQGVEYHVTQMLRRLRAPTRAALVSRAYSMGLLDVATWPPRVPPNFVK